MTDSRLSFFEKTLAMLGWNNALRAMDWMVEVMCAANGYKRHDGSDYFFHMIEGAQDMLDCNIREEAVITGFLLHDAAEDVDGITLRMIENSYGTRVASSVGLVTKIKSVNYRISENMVAMLVEILKSRDASLMKTCDRKHNFGSLRDASPEKKMRQAVETETHYIPFFDQCTLMYSRYDYYFLSAKRAILPHLWEIKSHHEEVMKLKAEVELLKGVVTL